MRAITEPVRRLPIDLTHPCLLWNGNTSDEGYGRLMIDSRTLYAHRISYQLHVGPIPRGWQIDHLCRVRHCYQPAHLEAVTSAENSARGNHPLYVIARQQVCKRGHSLAAGSPHVYVRPNGHRRCVTCSRMTPKQRREFACAG